MVNLFVYGTLKRGECRESMWPRQPSNIWVAYVRATLFDLGPYPAIRVEETEDAGATDELDWVRGEVWSFNENDLPETLSVLDEIEGTNQPGSYNLYDHVAVRCYDDIHCETFIGALAYQYSSSRNLRYSRRLHPHDGESFVYWSASTGRS